MNNTGVVKIVVRQAPRDGLTPVPPLAPAPRPASSGLQAALTPRPTLSPSRLSTPTLSTARAPIPAPTLVRPLLKLVHSPSPDVSGESRLPILEIEMRWGGLEDFLVTSEPHLISMLSYFALGSIVGCPSPNLIPR